MAIPEAAHTAYLYDRGGEVRIGQLTETSSIQWSRERNAISEATVTVTNPSEECCSLLQRIEPWRHEIVVYRGDQRVWDGVLLTPQWSREQVAIEAKDLLIWTQRAILKSGYADFRVSVVQRAGMIVQQEMQRFEALNPAINLLPYLTVYPNNTTRESREILDFEKYVYEELEDLASAGAHHATVGRRIYIWNRADDALGTTHVVTEQDFIGDAFTATAHGMDFGTFASATDGEGHHGDAGGVDAYYGLVERLSTRRPEGRSDPDDVDLEALREQARLDLAGRNPVPVRLRAALQRR